MFGIPFFRLLFLLSFFLLFFTFVFDSQSFSFTIGTLKISSETHVLFILGSGIAFIQGLFIWFITFKKDFEFPELIGQIHFFATFFSLFGLQFFAKQMPSSLFLTKEEAVWIPYFNGAIIFTFLLYTSSFILFISSSILLILNKSAKKEVEQ